MSASLLLIGTSTTQAWFPPYFQHPPREIDPIVSTDWLASNLGTPKLVILDDRLPFEYGAGHIPGAINSPASNWYINPPFGPEWPWYQLPPDDYLFELIGNAGITPNSLVVVVGRTSGLTPYPYLYAIADTSRVVVTLLYAGVRNVAILDGGHSKWAAELKPVTTDIVVPTPVTYTGVVNTAMFVSKDYVEKKIGKSIIVDARDPDVYFGVTQEPWAAYPGHIPTAKCLPTPWLWNLAIAEYATYKDANVLREMASGVIGRYVFGWYMFKEIIVYCGVGGYASPMYFVLSEVLGYKNVKIYDGSAQEWTGLGAPVVTYRWE